MNTVLRVHTDKIISSAIAQVLPDAAVQRALAGKTFPGKVVLVAAGKAAWQMAKAAHDCLGDTITNGFVLTKYDHVMGKIGNFVCCEGAHPVPDENTFIGTQKVIDEVQGLSGNDTVLFLLSGGGSALFEKPLVSNEQLQDITKQLLASGADIVQMNTIRKRLSAVKGGRFAQLCAPAQVYSIVLSDVLGDPLDMIASGPAYPDSSTCEQALGIVKQYGLHLSEQTMALLYNETPKQLDNVTTVVSGSVRELCEAAKKTCTALGYTAVLLTDALCCEARQAGDFLASVVKTHYADGKKLAFIAGGETVVKLTGSGLGGRNQELALSAAIGLDGLENACVFSVGSDGTDGPTDAAGGYVDGKSAQRLREQGIDIYDVLKNNDAYHALQKINGLIMTGPTGTNVNDVAVALING